MTDGLFPKLSNKDITRVGKLLLKDKLLKITKLLKIFTKYSKISYSIYNRPSINVY